MNCFNSSEIFLFCAQIVNIQIRGFQKIQHFSLFTLATQKC